MTRAAPILFALTVALLGCGEDVGSGTVVGSLILPNCEDGQTVRFTCADGLDDCAAFRLDMNFFGFERIDDSARLTMQRGGQILGRTDGLIWEIDDIRELRGRLGQPLTVGPEANIRVGLGLFELCPDTTQNFELTGTITFDRFGVSRGDKVSGRIDRLEVRDGRRVDGIAGPALGLLRGSFDFTLELGQPYQRFTR